MAVKLKLHVLLAEKRMTQTELSKRTRIRIPTINGICNDRAKHLPIDVIDKICGELGCAPGDWITWEPHEPPPAPEPEPAPKPKRKPRREAEPPPEQIKLGNITEDEKE